MKDVERRMVSAFRRGRKERIAGINVNGEANETARGDREGKEDDKDGFKITFHSVEQYLDIARLDPAQALDEREMGYWNNFAVYPRLRATA